MDLLARMWLLQNDRSRRELAKHRYRKQKTSVESHVCHKAKPRLLAKESTNEWLRQMTKYISKKSRYNTSPYAQTCEVLPRGTIQLHQTLFLYVRHLFSVNLYKAIQAKAELPSSAMKTENIKWATSQASIDGYLSLFRIIFRVSSGVVPWRRKQEVIHLLMFFFSDNHTNNRKPWIEEMHSIE